MPNGDHMSQPRSPRCRMSNCSSTCSGRLSASSGRAHIPSAGLRQTGARPGQRRADDLVAIGGSGFGVMALIVAVERGWISARSRRSSGSVAMLDLLTARRAITARCRISSTAARARRIPFWRKDDGGDLVETSFLCMGLALRAAVLRPRQRQRNTSLRARHHLAVGGGRVGLVHAGRAASVLYWHWSPNNGWAIDHEIHGWNECLVTYVLAAGSAALSDRPARLSPRLRRGAGFPQRQELLRHRAAARHGLTAGRCSSPTTPSAASIRAA